VLSEAGLRCASAFFDSSLIFKINVQDSLLKNWIYLPYRSGARG
jgi:hypothetical protein